MSAVVQGQKSRFVDPENLPPKPIYVFRGHVAEITALRFIRNNTRLVSGDSEGWVVVWNMTSRRHVAVWKAHDAGVLALCAWHCDKLITHGREGKVFVWRFSEEEEVNLDPGLPADGGSRRKPWLLYSIDVKEMTFCGIDVVCPDEDAYVAVSSGGLGELIDIHRLPSKSMCCSAIGKNPPEKLGMTMCLRISEELNDDGTDLTLIAGYESGHACVYKISSSSWSLIYIFRAHSQPVLSLCKHPQDDYFYTTSADANLVQHPIAIATKPIKTVNTKHSGQTGLQIQGDGRLILSAGWDGSGRVYSSRTLQQIAVLKWHVGGLQAAAFSTGQRWIVLGGKDAKITLWDLFKRQDTKS